MSFLWSLTFTFYVLLFNHSLFLAVLPLPHSAHPLSSILPGQPFSFTNSILSTNNIPQWYGIPQTSSFPFALPSGTELCIHPSDRLLFLTCTLLRTTPPSLVHGLQVSFYSRKQLLTSDFSRKPSWAHQCPCQGPQPRSLKGPRGP